jgi:two-component system, LytTR family, response regulator
MYGLRVLVVDPNAADRERLRILLSERVDVAKVREAESTPAAHHHLKQEPMDVAFVGVDSADAGPLPIPSDDGEGALPPTIFVGRDGAHAVQAFDQGAIDYLVKPLTPYRVELALRRVRATIGTNPTGDQHVLASNNENEAVARAAYSDRLVVKVGARYVFERMSNVIRVDAEGNYVRVFVSGRNYVLRKTMADIEATLDPKTFLRVHRSSIVNFNFIKAIEPLYHGEYRIMMEDGTTVATGRLFRDRVRRLIRNSA